MEFSQPSPDTVGVLIVDADPAQRRAIAGLISERTQGRFAPRGCAGAEEALAVARGGSRSVLIADLETIGGRALRSEMSAAAPLIATSVNGSLNAAIAAVRGGAIDFLPKPIGARVLLERLDAAVAEWHPPAAQRPVPEPQSAAGANFAGFIGRSRAMREVFDQIRRIAASRAPVFVTGESGTGKELSAQAVHDHAGPPGRPFVAINCSAIPRDLMESEIFGHVRGAYTGAADDRAGAAELADGGTLFLDEIAEMDLALQAKLLRFVQTGGFRRVGGNEVKRVEVRIVCATNRDPLVEVEAGRFRADLFYRLHVLPIHLQPLRERPDDVLPLAEAFLARFAAEEGRAFRGFSAEAVDILLAGAWPGNVRQLENTIRRIVVLNDGDRVAAGMFDDALPRLGNGFAANTAAALLSRPVAVSPYWRQEQQIIEAAVVAYDGNIARAAAALEISPSTIYRKRQAWSERMRAAS
jgi:two-component system repressor protein LuxO